MEFEAPPPSEGPNFDSASSVGPAPSFDHESVGRPDQLSLASVNDFQADEESVMVDASHHKWHPHTIKVLNFLRKSIAADPLEQTTFSAMTSSTTSRRTAAACFFELLQLKTLNFIKIDQSSPYGEIKVSKGTRFEEQISNNA